MDCRAILDERAGRSCAIKLGLEPLGTLGILVQAKREDFLPAVRPCISDLLAAGYHLHEALIRIVLDKVGE